MNGEAIISVSAAVVALTQICKWGGLPDRWGPVAVILLAAIGVGVWGYSQGGIMQADVFTYFAGGVAVATSAAGVFGFTRAGASAVISASPPPKGGAGSSTTVSS